MLLPVGGDHLGLPPQLENQIEAVSDHFPYQFVLSDLPSYLALIGQSELTRETIAGELHRCDTSAANEEKSNSV